MEDRVALPVHQDARPPRSRSTARPDRPTPADRRQLPTKHVATLGAQLEKLVTNVTEETESNTCTVTLSDTNYKEAQAMRIYTPSEGEAPDLNTYKDRFGTIAVDDLSVEVRIADARLRFGHLDLLVTPVAGSGQRWVEQHRVQIA